MAIYKVQKRNGAIVTFDRTKIEQSIHEAIQSVGGTDFSDVRHICDVTIGILKEKHPSTIPNIEEIQDAVEEALIKE